MLKNHFFLVAFLASALLKYLSYIFYNAYILGEKKSPNDPLSFCYLTWTMFYNSDLDKYLFSYADTLFAISFNTAGIQVI